MSTTFTVTRDGVAESFELVVSGMTFAEARAFEKVTGLSFQAINEDPALRGNITALQALLWISMKRKDPTLGFSGLDDVEILAIDWDISEEDAARLEAAKEGGAPLARSDDEPGAGLSVAG